MKLENCEEFTQDTGTRQDNIGSHFSGKTLNAVCNLSLEIQKSRLKSKCLHQVKQKYSEPFKKFVKLTALQSEFLLLLF